MDFFRYGRIMTVIGKQKRVHKDEKKLYQKIYIVYM